MTQRPLSSRHRHNLPVQQVRVAQAERTTPGARVAATMASHLRKALVPTVTKHSVPKVFHEPHVETGFRHTNLDWTYYLLSIFQKHNECMNVWTHLLALVVVVVRSAMLWWEFDLLTDVHMWPLAASLITMIVLYSCSSFAHCFSNKSELIHYTCFIIDYAGIGLYGLGSTILHYAYCLHETFINSWAHRYATPMGVFLAIAVCMCCSISKTWYSRPYPFTRRLWQLSSVFAIYLWLIFPIWHRIFRYLYYGDWIESLDHHIPQTFWFFTGGFFFGSDVPQRFFPGKFDFVGHSHQLFHICIMMTTVKQLDGIYDDIKEWRINIDQRPVPTFWGTFGAVGFTIVANTLVVVLFREVAKYKISKEKAALKVTEVNGVNGDTYQKTKAA